jgi:hypothetical protein
MKLKIYLILAVVLLFSQPFLANAVLPDKCILQKLNDNYSKVVIINKAVVRHNNELRSFDGKGLSLKNDGENWEVVIKWEEGKIVSDSKYIDGYQPDKNRPLFYKVVIDKGKRKFEFGKDKILYQYFNHKRSVSIGVFKWKIENNSENGDEFVALELLIGVQDKKGKFVIEPLYTDVNLFEKTFFKVSEYNKMGLFSLDGKQVIPIRYTSIQTKNDSIFKVAVYNKFGLYTRNGKLRIEPNYTKIEDSNCGYKVWEYNKVGLMSFKGELIIPVKYTKVDPIRNGLVKVWVYNKCGFISPEWKEVIPPVYTRLDSLDRDRFKAWNYNKCGLIDRNGKVLIPAKFTHIGEFIDGKAEAKIYSTSFTITEDGKILN